MTGVRDALEEAIGLERMKAVKHRAMAEHYGEKGDGDMEMANYHIARDADANAARWQTALTQGGDVEGVRMFIDDAVLKAQELASTLKSEFSTSVEDDIAFDNEFKEFQNRANDARAALSGPWRGEALPISEYDPDKHGNRVLALMSDYSKSPVMAWPLETGWAWFGIDRKQYSADRVPFAFWPLPAQGGA